VEAGRRAEAVGVREEKPLDNGVVALVRRKLAGFRAESLLLLLSGHLERLGERKMTGSTFSASSSNIAALRLTGVLREGNAIGDVRLMLGERGVS